MPEKKTKPVTVFFGESDYMQLCRDAFDDGREPADFLRNLWRLHRAAKVREWADECEQKDRALAASNSPQRTGGVPAAATVDGFLASFTRQADPMQERDWFETTRPMGDKR